MKIKSRGELSFEFANDISLKLMKNWLMNKQWSYQNKFEMCVCVFSLKTRVHFTVWFKQPLLDFLFLFGFYKFFYLGFMGLDIYIYIFIIRTISNQFTQNIKDLPMLPFKTNEKLANETHSENDQTMAISKIKNKTWNVFFKDHFNQR